MTHTKTAARKKFRRLYVPISEDFKFTSMIMLLKILFLWKIDLRTNIFVKYFHDISDLFKKRQLCMSKVIGDSHRWGLVPNNLACFALIADLGHYTA